jgi:neurocalcin delta
LNFEEKNKSIEFSKAIYELIGDEIEKRERQIEAEERAMNIFTMMDKNSDGILSREEFIDGCLNDEQLYQLLTQSSRLGDGRGSQSSFED